MNYRPSLSVLSGAAAIALCLFSAPVASATPITPVGTFGALSAATFGGTGIPNTAVEVTQIGNLTLGLTATARYADPTVTNDGAGTFYAQVGNDAAQGKPGYSQWNFDYYIGGSQKGITTQLFYDTNPAAGNDVTAFIPGFLLTGQDSLNLGMSLLGGSSFNPSAAGEYGFALVAYNSDHVEVGRSAIVVSVGNPSSVPDSGSTGLMLGSLLTAGLFFRRRSKK